MSDVTAHVRRGDAVTVAGIARPAPGRPGVPRMSAAPPRGNAIPFWCLMFFTFVLFLAPQVIFPSLEPLRLGMVSAGLGVAAYILNLLWNRRPLTVATPEVRLVSWFTLLAVVSIPLSLSPRDSLDYFLSTFVKSVASFFLIANLLDTMGRLKLLIAFIVLSGIVYSATGLYNFAIGPTLPDHLSRIQGYPSLHALNPDDLGLVLNVILCLTFGLYLLTRRRLVKALLAVGMTLMVGGVIVSLSRGAFLALAVTFAVFLAKLLWARGPLVLVPASGLVVLGMLLAPAGYGDRLYSLFDWNRDRVGSIYQRWHEVQVASTFVLENPLIGAGVGQDHLAYVEHGGGGTTHNIFLQVGTELGLPGQLIYVLLFVQILRGLRRTQRQLGPVPEAREVVAVAISLELAVYSFLVGASFLPFAHSFTFYYLAGMAAAVRVMGARLAASPSPTR